LLGHVLTSPVVDAIACARNNRQPASSGSHSRANIGGVADITLRAATLADVDSIAAVWHAAWRDGHLGHVPDALVPERTLAEFRRRVPQRIPTSIVAEDAEGVVAFVTVEHDELEQLMVAGRARGTDTAARLLSVGEALIAEHHPTAWLSVVAGNARARRFYAREGWHDAGPIDYYAETSQGPMLVPSHRYEKQVRG
jgi:GNAT superfamily N-acetyltransferase